MTLRALVVVATLFAFGTPAFAKPSDWASVVDPTPKKKMAYDRSRSVERAPIKFAAASPSKAGPVKMAQPTKAEKKATKAPRRAKGKKTRR